ncbi:MAG: formylglycine-generating enzyme family protein [Candidatus Cybelea sp.]|jgi:formylglycine-generating enzyme required for sulfatase activity
MSLEVTGGTYDRTYNTADSTSGPPNGGWPDLADPATVSGFRMDKYLVTVGRFRQYVNYVTGAGGAPPANGSGIHTHLNCGLGLANSGSAGTYEMGWESTDWNTYIATGAGAASTWNTNLSCDATYETWTTTAGTQETLPINCVTWYEAYAFCIWDGSFLPSEAEWEYVAAGGNEQLEYPWDSTDPGTANQYAIYGDDNGDCYYPTGTLASCMGVANIAPVGTARQGAGYWGQLDMAGEVWEWNLDWYATYVNPCINCAYLTTTSSLAIRGGVFDYAAAYLLPPYRVSGYPMARSYNFGFRCARAP